MPELKKQKVPLTECLRNTIKNLRKEYDKNGILLSKELNRGASYISQIESGKIKDIEYNMIHNIIQHIINIYNDEYDIYIKNYILNTIKTLTKEKYYSELWIHTYILQDMTIDIPDDLLDFIKEKMNIANCDSAKLVEQINSSTSGLSHSSLESLGYMKGKLILKTFYGNTSISNAKEIMIYDLPENYVDQVISKKISSISYLNMKGILDALHQLLPVDYCIETSYSSDSILFNHGFFHSKELYDQINNNSQPTTSSSSPKTNTDKTIIFYDDIQVNYDKKFNDLKKEALEKIAYACDAYKEENPAYACDKIEQIINNLNYDLGLIISILSSDLNNLHVPSKRLFWEEYKSLVQKFSKNPIDS